MRDALHIVQDRHIVKQHQSSLKKMIKLGFIKGIFLQDIFPKAFIVQAGEEVWFLHMLSITCKLLFQHSNAFTHIKCLKEMRDTNSDTQVMGNTQSGLEQYLPRDYLKHMLRRFDFPPFRNILLWKTKAHRQCSRMALFGDTPSLYQKAAIDHHKVPITSCLEDLIEIHSGLVASPTGQGPGHI